MAKKLKGMSAVVTGSGSGIGREVARALVRIKREADVIIPLHSI